MKRSTITPLLLAVMTVMLLVSCNNNRETIDKFTTDLKTAAQNPALAKSGLSVFVNLVDIDSPKELRMNVTEDQVAKLYDRCGFKVSDKLSGNSDFVTPDNPDQNFSISQAPFPTHGSILRTVVAEAVKDYTPEQREALVKALNDQSDIVLRSPCLSDTELKNVIKGNTGTIPVDSLPSVYMSLAKKIEELANLQKANQ